MSSTDVSQTDRQGPNLTVDPIASLLAKLASRRYRLSFATLYNLVDSFWANRLGTVLGSPDPSTPWVPVQAISF